MRPRLCTRPPRLAAASAVAGLIWLTVAGALGLTGVAAQPRAGPRVLVTTIEGPITPVLADHVGDGVRRAERGGYSAYVLEMDTPGGLDTSMRQIVRHILGARVPVVVYVSPQGARAVSAGAVIAFSAHVAAMAPGTAIGAATPVSLGGDEAGAVETKIVEDAAAFVEELATLRDRNVEFAIATVREGRSAPARTAVEIGAVDLMARSLTDLLDEIDGTQVTLGAGDAVTLRTGGAAVERYDLGLFRQILQWLADPTIAFLLMSIGTLGIIYELASPGIGVGGIVGAGMILIGLFGLSVLPVSAVGFLFLLLALMLFVAELFAPGIGVFAFLGAAALVLSGVFLFRDTPELDVGLGALLPTAAVVGVGTTIAGRYALRARRAPVTTSGYGQFIGREVTVIRADGATGQAFVEGAWWRLRSATPLTEGAPVRVADVDGLTLVVELMSGTGAAGGEAAGLEPNPQERGSDE